MYTLVECKEEIVTALTEFTSQGRDSIKRNHILYTINSYMCLNYKLPTGETIKTLCLLLLYC